MNSTVEQMFRVIVCVNRKRTVEVCLKRAKAQEKKMEKRDEVAKLKALTILKQIQLN